MDGYDVLHGIAHFNPRTREGCDDDFLKLDTWVLVISIHAPARGATKMDDELVKRAVDFNPRTREGCDTQTPCLISRLMHFNPRTREGCDRGSASRTARSRHFNPRTREGCDS